MSEPHLTVSISGEGTDKEVEWHLDDLGIAISLEAVIAVAAREFSGISLNDLRIGGYGYCNNIDYSGGDYSEVRLSHKDGR